MAYVSGKWKCDCGARDHYSCLCPTPEPVGFADVRAGDTVDFVTADNGVGGSGLPKRRAGKVTKVSAKSVTVHVGGGQLEYRQTSHRGGEATLRGATARLRRADWYRRNVRRIKTAAARPYDADHVQYVDLGTTVLAVWTAEPELAAWFESLAGMGSAKRVSTYYRFALGPDSLDRYEVIRMVERSYAGGGRDAYSGWSVNDGNALHAMGTRSKPQAIEFLRDEVAERFASRIRKAGDAPCARGGE